MDTILIIDDDESFGESIEMFFKNVGFSTRRATNGQAGVELMEKGLPVSVPDRPGDAVLTYTKLK